MRQACKAETRTRGHLVRGARLHVSRRLDPTQLARPDLGETSTTPRLARSDETAPTLRRAQPRGGRQAPRSLTELTELTRDSSE